MIQIKNIDGRVLYTAETAADIRTAVVAAVKAKTYLRGADLGNAASSKSAAHSIGSRR